VPLAVLVKNQETERAKDHTTLKPAARPTGNSMWPQAPPPAQCRERNVGKNALVLLDTRASSWASHYDASTVSWCGCYLALTGSEVPSKKPLQSYCGGSAGVLFPCQICRIFLLTTLPVLCNAALSAPSQTPNCDCISKNQATREVTHACLPRCHEQQASST
jgi:hypothetical protein